MGGQRAWILSINSWNNADMTGHEEQTRHALRSWQNQRPHQTLITHNASALLPFSSPDGAQREE
jgi:hypothetical protein